MNLILDNIADYDALKFDHEAKQKPIKHNYVAHVRADQAINHDCKVLGEGRG